MSEDALQYAPGKREVMREMARILRPGALLAFTAFDLDPKRAGDLPILGSDPVSDYRPSLLDAGFAIVRLKVRGLNPTVQPEYRYCYSRSAR